MTGDELARLAKPFPKSLVKSKPGNFSADYVAHATVTEKLLATIGPFSFRVVELIRDHGDSAVVGCLAEMTVVIDGQEVTVVEVGDVEDAGAGNKNDGARAKDAASDALKRCAMRLGCGLHLWSRDAYALDRVLTRHTDDPTPAPA